MFRTSYIAFARRISACLPLTELRPMSKANRKRAERLATQVSSNEDWLLRTAEFQGGLSS